MRWTEEEEEGRKSPESDGRGRRRTEEAREGRRRLEMNVGGRKETKGAREERRRPEKHGSFQTDPISEKDGIYLMTSLTLKVFSF